MVYESPADRHRGRAGAPYADPVSEDLFGGGQDAAGGAGGTGVALSSGGSLSDADRPGLPLAVRMRPRSLDEIVGQTHLLAAGSPLRRLAAGEPMSVFLWGPPGTGKTTIASVVSRQSGARFVEVSAVTAGVKEVRAVLDQARRELARGQRTVLFVDEVHRFSKTQQDVLLPAVENRLVTLVAATTENPSFSVISPLLSRSLLLTLRPLTDADVSLLLDRALVDERGLGGACTLDDDARATLLRLAGGDARRALTYLEESAAGALALGETRVTTEVVERAVDRAAIRYDRDGDQHYDVISAFIKSVRGSDVQASLHYLARMLGAGEDPRFVARRLIILASEDIGLADPTALTDGGRRGRGRGHDRDAGGPHHPGPRDHRARPGAQVQRGRRRDRGGGRPTSPPAGSGWCRPHLRDAHYAGAKTYGHGQGYRYAHDEPHGIAAQQYLPGRAGRRGLLRPDRPRQRGRGVRAAGPDRGAARPALVAVGRTGPSGLGSARPARSGRARAPYGRRPARPSAAPRPRPRRRAGRRRRGPAASRRASPGRPPRARRRWGRWCWSRPGRRAARASTRAAVPRGRRSRRARPHGRRRRESAAVEGGPAR